MANYEDTRRRMTIDDSERSTMLNELLRDLSTSSMAARNRATDSATRRGASEGAQNALESGLNYSAGMAGEKGINSLNTQIDDRNRQANQYVDSLIEQDKARRTQLWSGIGSGVGSLLGFGLGSGFISDLIGGGDKGSSATPVMPDIKPTGGFYPKTYGSFDLEAFSPKLGFRPGKGNITPTKPIKKNYNIGDIGDIGEYQGVQ